MLHVSIFTFVCYTGITKQVWLLQYIPAFFMSSHKVCPVLNESSVEMKSLQISVVPNGLISSERPV